MLENAIKYNVENQAKINKICAPLETCFGVRLMQFRRFYLKGGLISLFNHAEWMKISFANKYWHSSVLHEKLQALEHKSSLVYLWPARPLKDAIYQGLYDNDLWNGVTIYKKFSDCIESYGFSSTRANTNIVAFYLSEIEILEHFILYFRSRLFPEILGTSEKHIIIPYTLQLPSSLQANKSREQFFQSTPINNYYIRTANEDVKLSKREDQCLSLLGLGMKVKEIAQALKISPRTVEFYIEQSKLKTGVTTAGLLKLHKKTKFSIS